MRVIRLYVTQELTEDDTIKLDDDSRHYALNVLRINKNTSLSLFNGDGYDYACELLTCNKKSADVKIIKRIPAVKESALTIRLFLGISKSTHMDYAIQKSVETGISSIHPLVTERTVFKLSEKSKSNKLQHWNKIIINACEQCGRATLPILHNISELTGLMPLGNNEHGFVFEPMSKKSLSYFSKDKINSVNLFVGPEGGLTRPEINEATTKGYQAVTIGPRILRTETAAVTAVISSQLLWGDLLATV